MVTIASLLIPSVADAATFIAQAFAGPGSEQKSSTTLPVSAVQSFQFLDVPTGSTAASATAQALVGAVKGSSFASAAATGQGCCTSYVAASASYVEYSDSFFLAAPGVGTGLVGIGTANINLTGALGGTGVGENWSIYGTYRASLFVNDQSFVLNGVAGAGMNGSYGSSDPFGLYAVPLELVFGRVNTVTLRLETRADASVNVGVLSSAAMASDLSSTLSWAGLASLTRGGTAVSDFSAVSADTGFDFRAGFAPAQAVPEPATWASLILGFVGVGALVRRRAPAGPLLAG